MIFMHFVMCSVLVSEKLSIGASWQKKATHHNIRSWLERVVVLELTLGLISRLVATWYIAVQYFFHV